MNYRKLLLIIALVTSLAAHAQTAEPTSFLGVKLRAPLKESVPDCRAKIWPEPSEGFCTTSAHKDMRNSPIWNNPAWHQSYFATELNARVESVYANFDVGDLAKVSKALIEKFGEPTTNETSVVQNAMGAKFDKTVLTWQWPTTRMRLESRRDDNLNLGDITVNTSEYDKFVSTRTRHRRSN
jgi:hypothetical protein